MVATYTTILGDEWDVIAKKVYGSEMYADFLMENNPDLLGTFTFSAGTVLYVPKLPNSVKESTEIPEWRK